MESNITGFILAGGQSQRMGTSKAFVRLNGKPLIDYVFETLREVTPNIFLSIGSIPIRHKHLQVVEDIYPDCGPVGGIYSALRFSKTDLNLIISCDMPFVQADLLKFLVEQAFKEKPDVTLPVDENGSWQPLCAIYRQSILPNLETAILRNTLKLKAIVAEVHSLIIPIENAHINYQPNSFLNINTPDDLHQTKKQ